MNKLSTAKKVAVISALVEGCSIRSTSRMTGVAKGTILSLLASVGTACAQYQHRVIRNVPAQRIQADEIICGDIWTFTAIDAETKLVISWGVGRRDAGFATDFLRDVAGRVSNRV